MVTIKALMVPNISDFKNEESGIRRVVEAYHRYAKDHNIAFVDCKVTDTDQYDVYVVHAGMTTRFPFKKPIVSMIHGLYWTNDYSASLWEWKANANVIASIRYATNVTVPSSWVAETLQRDMRVNPFVIPHGIEYKEWEHDLASEGFVLWNKNRNADVCSPEPVGELAIRAPSIPFVTTFKPSKAPANVYEVGLKPHDEMKKLIQTAGVYLSTTKETFGIGALEALAAGTPVLGYANGGNLITVEHGVNGYLARPGDADDLASGLEYCVKYRDVLSKNAKESAKQWSWDSAVKRLSNILYATVNIWKNEYDRKRRPYRIDDVG